MTKKYTFFKSLVPLIPRICLIVIVALVALSIGCGVPQEQKVTEVPDLLKNIHGTLIYATYSLNHENDTFTVNYKNLYMLDLDAASNSADMLTELQFVNRYGPLNNFPRASWINGIVPSPDNKKVAFFKEDGLYIYDIEYKQTTKITKLPGISIAWHPDSQSLACVLTDKDLYIVNIDGTKIEKIVQHNGGEYGLGSQGDINPTWIETYIKHPTWAISGSEILFDDFAGGKYLKQGEKIPSAVFLYNIKTQKKDLLGFYEKGQYGPEYTSFWELPTMLPSSSQIPDNDELIAVSEYYSTELLRFDPGSNKWKYADQRYLTGKTFLLSPVKGKFLSFYDYNSHSLLYYDNYQMKTISLSGFMKEAWGGVWSNDGRYVAITGNSGIMFLEPGTQNVTRLNITVDNGESIQLVEWY
jgi:hypothetical protein